jgi:N-acetyl sugar amidotransferase
MQIEPYRYNAIKLCTHCIIDDTIPGITFDENGVCPFCRIQKELEAKFPLNEKATEKLNKIVEKIKLQGKGKKYDCIVGVSGGRDSTYTLYTAVKLGLRPLAVHFDNGWNSEIAVQNIKNATKKLGVDLYTYIADWEEFKDLQKAFLKASVPDGEVPTDWVILSVLYDISNKEGIKFFIGGHSFRTEGTAPLTWTYQDPKYVSAIHRKYGKTKIKSFPIMSMSKFLYYSFVKRIKYIRLLYYIPYEEKKVIELLKNELQWIDYGGKHFESTYTTFFQSYILTRKFNIDKRKLHYSALIRSEQITREEALEKIKIDPYQGGLELLNYNLKKLELSESDFKDIMDDSIKTFRDYPSYYQYIKFLRKPLILASKIGIIPDVIIKKYFSFDPRDV